MFYKIVPWDAPQLNSLCFVLLPSLTQWCCICRHKYHKLYISILWSFSDSQEHDKNSWNPLYSKSTFNVLRLWCHKWADTAPPELWNLLLSEDILKLPGHLPKFLGQSSHLLIRLHPSFSNQDHWEEPEHLVCVNWCSCYLAGILLLCITLPALWSAALEGNVFNTMQAGSAIGSAPSSTKLLKCF